MMQPHRSILRHSTPPFFRRRTASYVRSGPAVVIPVRYLSAMRPEGPPPPHDVINFGRAAETGGPDAFDGF